MELLFEPYFMILFGTLFSLIAFAAVANHISHEQKKPEEPLSQQKELHDPFSQSAEIQLNTESKTATAESDISKVDNKSHDSEILTTDHVVNQNTKPASNQHIANVHSNLEATKQPDIHVDLYPESEGARSARIHYAAVRSDKLRKAAIEIHGSSCCVCGFNFDETFGKELSNGYIEVHHLKSIADGIRVTDPRTDLVPLCSNCHAMADRLAQNMDSPPNNLSDLKNLLRPV